MTCNKCGIDIEQDENLCSSCKVENSQDISDCSNEYNNLNAVWNPKAIKYISILCSLIPGAILFSMNYARLKHPKAKKQIFSVVGVTLLFFLLASLTPQNILLNGIFLVANISIAVYFGNDQKKLYDIHIESGGRKASIVIPLILSILFIIAYIVLLVAVSLSKHP